MNSHKVFALVSFILLVLFILFMIVSQFVILIYHGDLVIGETNFCVPNQCDIRFNKTSCEIKLKDNSEYCNCSSVELLQNNVVSDGGYYDCYTALNVEEMCPRLNNNFCTFSYESARYKKYETYKVFLSIIIPLSTMSYVIVLSFSATSFIHMYIKL